MARAIGVYALMGHAFFAVIVWSQGQVPDRGIRLDKAVGVWGVEGGACSQPA